MWSAFAGSQPTAVAVLTRWPDLRALGRAPLHPDRRRRGAHPRRAGRARPGRGDPRRRQGLDDFWDGHLDLDALAWEVGRAPTRHARSRRADRPRHRPGNRYWADLYGDDPLLASVPGLGPMTAPTVRAFLGDGPAFTTAKATASYVGMNPSTWSSGTVVQPSRAITKEGPAVLRLAFYQAAGGARRVDPQLAAYYRHLMVDRGHGHTKATVAVARKLIERTWTVLDRGQPYQSATPTAPADPGPAAKELARTHAVPPDVRARARARSAATHRSKLTKIDLPVRQPEPTAREPRHAPRTGPQGLNRPGVSGEFLV